MEEPFLKPAREGSADLHDDLARLSLTPDPEGVSEEGGRVEVARDHERAGVTGRRTGDAVEREEDSLSPQLAVAADDVHNEVHAVALEDDAERMPSCFT